MSTALLPRYLIESTHNGNIHFCTFNLKLIFNLYHPATWHLTKPHILKAHKLFNKKKRKEKKQPQPPISILQYEDTIASSRRLPLHKGASFTILRYAKIEFDTRNKLGKLQRNKYILHLIKKNLEKKNQSCNWDYRISMQWCNKLNNRQICKIFIVKIVNIYIYIYPSWLQNCDMLCYLKFVFLDFQKGRKRSVLFPPTACWWSSDFNGPWGKKLPSP